MTFSGRCLMPRSSYLTVRERVSVTKADYRNPKAEGRGPKEGRRPKPEVGNCRRLEAGFGAMVYSIASRDCGCLPLRAESGRRLPQSKTLRVLLRIERRARGLACLGGPAPGSD